jgi:hypothetical protein
VERISALARNPVLTSASYDINEIRIGVRLNPYFLFSQLEDYLSDNATEETQRALTMKK